MMVLVSLFKRNKKKSCLSQEIGFSNTNVGSIYSSLIKVSQFVTEFTHRGKKLKKSRKKLGRKVG
jgi:hypothetical protein